MAAAAKPKPLRPRDIPADLKARLSGLNLDACYTCGTCSSGCPITGIEGVALDTRKAVRMMALGLIDELVDSEFPWLCTGCGRCSYGCPQGIDIWYCLASIRALRRRDKVPGILHKGVMRNLASGNNMAVPIEDYLSTMKDVGRELAEEGCPGFYVPVDKQDARALFFPNSKEVYGDFEDMKWWWKIFYAARESWTVPSRNWEAVDWGLFTANTDAVRTFARRKIDIYKNLGCQTMIMPDCGGGSYGCRAGIQACSLDDPSTRVNYTYLYSYLRGLLEAGKVTIDKSVNEGKRFTWHDSCKHGRELERHFGGGFYEEPRWIIHQLVDDYVEMVPNRANNFCCGAGGGNWPMPYEKQSAAHGRFKVEQILRSGADVVVVGCSNCRDQMMRRLPKYFPELKCEVKYIWELVADSLVITPWSEEEIARAAKEEAAQWKRFGLPDEE
jgi:Fe-S oxidoreductase